MELPVADPTGDQAGGPVARRSGIQQFSPYQRPTVIRQLPVRSPRERKVTTATAHLLDLYKKCGPNFRYTANSNPRRVLTRPDEGVYNNGFDNVRHDYILHVNDVLSSSEDDEYVVIDMLGTGTFGQVVKCRHLRTGQIVAIKVIKNEPAYSRQAQMELNILKMIHERNSKEEVKHIVMLLGKFEFRDHLCLVFEKLSINLFELIRQNKYRGLGLGLLRSFVKQILRTLEVLDRTGVIHCDLKPENILLENLNSTAIKIIDFGSACLDHQVVYSYVQSRFYRSPEVLLSMKYNSKIDVWSLGCIAGELFLGLPLFPGSSEENMVFRIIEMIDCPSREMLNDCAKAKTYFNFSYCAGETIYELKDEEQFFRERGQEVVEWKRYFSKRRLRDIVMNYPYRTTPSKEDIAMRECFAHFLTGLLQIDPRMRWSPSEAMLHPFIHGQVLPKQMMRTGLGSRDFLRHKPRSEIERSLDLTTLGDSSGQRSRGDKENPTKKSSSSARSSSGGGNVVLPKSMREDTQNRTRSIKFGTYSPSPALEGASEPGGAASQSSLGVSDEDGISTRNQDYDDELHDSFEESVHQQISNLLVSDPGENEGSETIAITNEKGSTSSAVRFAKGRRK